MSERDGGIALLRAMARAHRALAEHNEDGPEGWRKEVVDLATGARTVADDFDAIADELVTSRAALFVEKEQSDDLVSIIDAWQKEGERLQAALTAAEARAVRCEGVVELAQHALEAIRSDIARSAQPDDPAMVLFSIDVTARDALQALGVL